jgi:hypothetical protein
VSATVAILALAVFLFVLAKACTSDLGPLG